jgi:site-specific recombinase XerC
MADTATNTALRNLKNARVLRKNLSHNVEAPLDAAQTSLAELATVYLVTEATGSSHATLDAKRRDLQRFLSFYQGLYKHDRPDEWFVSVTKAFLKALHRERLAQASLARIYATVRHFARWLHQKFPALFPLGPVTRKL